MFNYGFYYSQVVLPNLMILLLRESYLVCDRKQLVMRNTHLKLRVSPHPQTTPHVCTYLVHPKKVKQIFVIGQIANSMCNKEKMMFTAIAR